MNVKHFLLYAALGLFTLTSCTKEGNGDDKDSGNGSGSPSEWSKLDISDAKILYIASQTGTRAAGTTSALYKITNSGEDVNLVIHDKDGNEIEFLSYPEPQIYSVTPGLLCITGRYKASSKDGSSGTVEQLGTWLLRKSDGAIFDIAVLGETWIYFFERPDRINPYPMVDKEGYLYRPGSSGTVEDFNIEWIDENGVKHHKATYEYSADYATWLWKIGTSASGGLSATKMKDCYAVDYDGNLWGSTGRVTEIEDGVVIAGDPISYFYQPQSGERVPLKEQVSSDIVIYGHSGSYSFHFDPESKMCTIKQQTIGRDGTITTIPVYQFTSSKISEESRVTCEALDGLTILYWGNVVIWFNSPSNITHTESDENYLGEIINGDGWARAGSWLYYYAASSSEINVLNLKTQAKSQIQIESIYQLDNLSKAACNEDGTLTIKGWRRGQSTIATLFPSGQINIVKPEADPSKPVPDVIEFVQVN